MMQQTERYKLNLIETSDVFSPAPLNENAEKLEVALLDSLAAEAQARTTGDAALDARVTVLEAHKLIWGSYSPGEKFISLGVDPVAVVVCRKCGTDPCAIAVVDGPFTYASGNSPQIRIVPGGFETAGEFNNGRDDYRYIAFA